MIIEKFRPDKVREMYKRFEEKGRQLPEGLRFINSWINEEVTLCYQLMETENIKKLYEWIDRWKDVAEFEIVKVISSAEAKTKILG